MKLTPANARDLPPGQSLKCHEVPGLELRAGSERKSWRLYYTTRGGIERRPTLGHFPEMTLSAARRVAVGLRERVALGEDPGAEWKAAREAPTVGDLIDRYLAEWVDAKNGDTWATEVHRYARRIRLGLGHMRVADVRRHDVDKFLAAVLARKWVGVPKTKKDGKVRKDADVKTAPVAMNRCRSIISKMFYYAEELGWVVYDFRPGAKLHTNPARHAERSTERKRKVIAKPDMLPRLVAALDHIATEYPDDTVKGVHQRRQVACMWTIFLTGARVGEILNATGIELQADGIVKTEHKTARYIGDKTIAVPRVARAMIEQLPVCESGRLFGVIGLRWIWDRVRSEADLPGLQLRDARRTWASFARSMGVPTDQIADQFGHTDINTAHENYTFMLQHVKQDLAERVAENILATAQRERIG